MQSSSMIDDGKVCLMSLDAIRQRLGPRWLARRERVYDHAQQSLRRQLGPHGFFLRVSETDFLVAQPNVGRLAGQAYCLNCLREVLTYFLGEALIGDIMVHEVTSDRRRPRSPRKRSTPPTVEAEARAADARRARPGPGPRRRAQPDVAGPLEPFTAHDGRRLRASCSSSRCSS